MNAENTIFVRTLITLAAHLPLYLVMGTGAVISLCLMKRHLGVSLLVFFGLGIIAFTHIGEIAVHSFGSYTIIRAYQDTPPADRFDISKRLQTFQLTVNGISSALTGGGYVMLLCAAFCWRRQKPTSDPIHQKKPAARSPFRQ